MTEIDVSVGPDRVELCGRGFTVAPKLGLMPLLKFAHTASKGGDSGDMDSMAAMYELLRSVINDDEWASFEQHAMDVRAGDDDLLGAVQGAISIMTARPTSRPSVSSDGPSVTEMNSSGGSLSLVSSIPAPTNALDLRAAQELRPVEQAALDLIAN